MFDKNHKQRINVKYIVKLKKLQVRTPALPKMKRMSKSNFKAMQIGLFDINSIVMTEWVPKG